MIFHPEIENLILPMLSYLCCGVSAVHWLYWNSRIWSLNDVVVMLNDVIISCRISAYAGTYGGFFKHGHAVFNVEQEK